jgi:hypothetical protein
MSKYPRLMQISIVKELLRENAHNPKNISINCYIFRRNDFWAVTFLCIFFSLTHSREANNFINQKMRKFYQFCRGLKITSSFILN